jgi:hypothetical protein
VKFKSQVLTQASGSVGGVTYAHNAGGLYQRARSIPTDPATAQQQVVRNAVSQLVTRWNNILTQVQRDSWDVYGQNVPVIDTLGDSILISGIAWYIKSNVPRRQIVTAPVDPGPTVFSRESLTDPSFEVTAATDIASVVFDNTDGWANEVGGFLMCFFSRPQNASINFFKGPYRFADVVTGAAVPPASPAPITLPFPVAVGNKVFGRFLALGSDGRTSPSFRGSDIAG